MALHAPFLAQHHAGFKTLAALAEIKARRCLAVLECSAAERGCGCGSRDGHGP